MDGRAFFRILLRIFGGASLLLALLLTRSVLNETDSGWFAHAFDNIAWLFVGILALFGILLLLFAKGMGPTKSISLDLADDPATAAKTRDPDRRPG